MIRRLVLIAAVVLVARPAAAHVGSPDVYYDGDAGPYHVFVTVRMPKVIPGIATIEIRTREPDITDLTVVPMRLSGPGSELAPAPDHAARSAADRQFFTASLWLMEQGALQVRIHVDGAAGAGTLAIPILAQPTKMFTMNRTLGAALFGLMALLALALVAIAGAAAREAALAPGQTAPPRWSRKSAIATAIASVIVVGVIGFGNAWWTSEAKAFARGLDRPWVLAPELHGCELVLPIKYQPLPDHGHDVHLFVVRTPSFDRLAHLHPVRASDGTGYHQVLPPLPAGRYALFADVVWEGGWPKTGTAVIDLPDLTACPAPTGDDAAWSADAPTTAIRFAPPLDLHANRPVALAFRVVDPATGAPATDVEPYMAMAGHAAVIRTDLGVFAHLHPSGTVTMPQMMIAGTPHVMYADTSPVPPGLAFPYGFPAPGHYKLFVQVKRAGKIETGAFDLDVPP